MPMSPTTSLGADQLMEGPGDAHDLVELEYSAPDHHHEQIARDARRARLRRVRYEGEAARGVAICEPRQAHTSAVGPDRKDLRALAIGEEDGTPGARGQSLGQRALEDTLALTARPDPPELAGSGLPGRLRVPVACDPQLVRLVHGKDARTRHAHVGWIEHLPARVQAEHHATLPVGHVHGARSVDDAALRLHEKESHSFLGRAAREELGAAVAHAIEGADPPIAIEGGDEEIAAAPAAADLRVDEGRPGEVARLRRRSEARAPRRNAIQRRQIFVLAATVATPRAPQVEHTLVVHHQRARRGNASTRGTRGGLEALARDVDADREPGSKKDLRG